MSMTVALSLPRENSSITLVRRLLDRLLASVGCSGDCRADWAVMVSEACTNAVGHSQGEGDVEVTIMVQDDRCTVEVGNPDGSFDERTMRAAMPDPMAEGGRGLPLIRILADTVQILHPRPGWVLVRMVKRLVQATPTWIPAVA